ncbi:MAG: hypothetical protein QM446_09835, partial [Synergistota bacterium]|nr:hypothetical protein [Synergistota bacterium]
DELVFDEQERLFLDFGVVDQRLTPFHTDLPSALNSRAPAGLFQYYSFSDHIAECYSMVMSKPVTAPRSGYSIEAKLSVMRKQLDELKVRTMDVLPDLLGMGGVYPSEAEDILDDFFRCIRAYTEVQMRTRKFREADEKERQAMSVDNRAFTEAEKRIKGALKLKSEEEEEEIPDGDLDEYNLQPPAPKLTEEDIKTAELLISYNKSLSRNIIYVEQELIKWDRRVKKKAKDLEMEAPPFRRRELRNMLETKKEYITLTAKSARLDDSQLCQSDKPPFSIDKAAGLLEEMVALDPDMLVVARVRMYGIPRVIMVPGQGFGTYDWNDHTLLLPVFPTYSAEKAALYALGTFRWDSDEDRVLKNSYDLIKENRNKSILELNSSFCKDYFLWMTKEKKGYRILPRATHRVFVQMFAPQKRE